MTKSPADWVRPHIKTLTPYTAARHLYDGREGVLLLDANENPYGSHAPGLAPDANRYPDPYCRDLVAALGDWLEIEPDWVRVGNGSDEALDLLVRTFVEPGDTVAIAVPSYGMYAITARAHAATIREVPLDAGFDVDLKPIRAGAAGAKLVFLCSPNNPTGNVLSGARIERLAERMDALIVVDEAYIEFSGSTSLVDRVERYPNLAVLRTFSKAWGLAGARVGYMVAHPDVLEYVDRINLPYPLSSISVRAALEALGRRDEMVETVRRIVEERDRLARRLETLGLEVFPSDANFLLVRAPDGAAVFRRLVEEFDIVVRDRGQEPGLENCLRVTVGRPEDSDRLCAALEAIIER